MVIGGQEFPDECPKNCPGHDILFDQGGLCSRCPIFNCREFEYEGTKVRMLNPEDFPEEIAKAWHDWFKEI